jgi:hypothetical protein
MRHKSTHLDHPHPETYIIYLHDREQQHPKVWAAGAEPSTQCPDGVVLMEDNAGMFLYLKG